MVLNVHKTGQGTIARLIGGAIGAILAYFGGQQLYIFLVKFMYAPEAWGIAIGVLGFLGLAWLSIYYLLINPKTSDYLIETELEMRKVNWPTKQELIGSTGVVIACVVILSVYIFLNDLVIGFVLKDIFSIF
tara:strand:+ start:1023 stop:1418 length:396 start_codon:yes stop_codon:yes gene_type:complete